MINKKNIFFASVLLLAVFVVAINFDKFTGESVRRAGKITEIEVFPKEILAGEKIYVNVMPGAHCTDLEAGVYKKGKNYAIARWREIIGHTNYCDPITIDYKTWSSWEEGEYRVKMRDIGTGTYVEDTFFIMAS